ncbi:MAG: PorP/SprF family type IX secretion system membrane protein [Bacteroidales bacterium]
MTGPFHRSTLGLLLLVLACPADGQDNILYRQHLIHPVLANPAVSGSEFFSVATLSYRKQWAGIPGSPQSMLFSTSLRIGNFGYYNPRKLLNTSGLRIKERIGLGLALYADENGPLVQRGGLLAYAYHLELNNARLSLGLSGSVMQYLRDESGLHGTYPDDPLLTGVRDSRLDANAGTGIYYYSPTLFGGVAVQHVLPLREEGWDGAGHGTDVLLSGGTLFREMGRPKLELSGSVRWLDGETLEGDLHLRSYIQEYHWVALSIHSYQALSAHVGIKIGVLHLVYTYEANLSNLIRYTAGTHALHLGLNTGIRRTRGF